VTIDNINSIWSGYATSGTLYIDVEATRKRNTVETNVDNINLRDNLREMYLSYGLYNKTIGTINLNKSLATFINTKQIDTCGITGK
jgi:hypothetical protein